MDREDEEQTRRKEELSELLLQRLWWLPHNSCLLHWVFDLLHFFFAIYHGYIIALHVQYPI